MPRVVCVPRAHRTRAAPSIHTATLPMRHLRLACAILALASCRSRESAVLDTMHHAGVAWASGDTAAIDRVLDRDALFTQFVRESGNAPGGRVSAGFLDTMHLIFAFPLDSTRSRAETEVKRNDDPFVSLMWRMHRAFPAGRGDSVRAVTLRVEDDSATAAVIGRMPGVAGGDTLAFRLARARAGWRIVAFANLPAVARRLASRRRLAMDSMTRALDSAVARVSDPIRYVAGRTSQYDLIINGIGVVRNSSTTDTIALITYKFPSDSGTSSLARMPAFPSFVHIRCSPNGQLLPGAAAKVLCLTDADLRYQRGGNAVIQRSGGDEMTPIDLEVWTPAGRRVFSRPEGWETFGYAKTRRPTDPTDTTFAALRHQVRRPR